MTEEVECTGGVATVETTGVDSNTTTVPTTAQVKSFVEGSGIEGISFADKRIASLDPALLEEAIPYLRGYILD